VGLPEAAVSSIVLSYCDIHRGRTPTRLRLCLRLCLHLRPILRLILCLRLRLNPAPDPTPTPNPKPAPDKRVFGEISDPEMTAALQAKVAEVTRGA
jgi:hypothetical protein